MTFSAADMKLYAQRDRPQHPSFALVDLHINTAFDDTPETVLSSHKHTTDV